MNQSEITDLIEETVESCTQFFKSKNWVRDDWECNIRYSFSPRRKTSWGGLSSKHEPRISLYLFKYLNTKKATFREYKAFSADPEIGTVYKNTEAAIRALVIHEMSHAVQQSSCRKRLGIKNDGPHGERWKMIYRETRNHLLNPYMKKYVGPTIDKALALELIAERKIMDWTNRAIILELVNEFGYKENSAKTYVYSVRCW